MDWGRVHGGIMGEITCFLLCQNQRLRSTNLINDRFHCYLHRGGYGMVFALVFAQKLSGKGSWNFQENVENGPEKSWRNVPDEFWSSLIFFYHKGTYEQYVRHYRCGEITCSEEVCALHRIFLVITQMKTFGKGVNHCGKRPTHHYGVDDLNLRCWGLHPLEAPSKLSREAI